MVAPGASRPTVDRIRYCRYFSGGIARLGGCVLERRIGIHTSVRAGNAKPSGMTPTMTAGASSIRDLAADDRRVATELTPPQGMAHERNTLRTDGIVGVGEAFDREGA